MLKYQTIIHAVWSYDFQIFIYYLTTILLYFNNNYLHKHLQIIPVTDLSKIINRRFSFIQNNNLIIILGSKVYFLSLPWNIPQCLTKLVSRFSLKLFREAIHHDFFVVYLVFSIWHIVNISWQRKKIEFVFRFVLFNPKRFIYKKHKQGLYLVFTIIW